MAQHLHSDHLPIAQDIPVAVAAAPDRPKKKSKEWKYGDAFRAALARAWHRNHSTGLVGHCGDSWPPMFLRCYSMI